MPPRRALGWALAAALALPAIVLAAPAGAAPDGLDRARERLERVSAQLAAARTAADGLAGAERERAERLERRLQERKDALMAREADLAAAEAAAPPAPEPSATPAASPAPAAIPPAPPVTLAAATRSAPTAPGDGQGLAARIDGYLASKASPLTGLGAVFVAEGRRVGLDPRLLVAIAGSETSFGTYGPSQAIHNPFGLGPHIEYPSWQAAIAAAATTLSGGYYVGEGRYTIAAIQQRWAPAGASNDPTNLNVNWTRNVSMYYAELGGDPMAPVFDARVTGGAGAGPGAPAAPPPPAAAVATEATAPGGGTGAGARAAKAALSALGAPSVRAGVDPARGVDAAGLARWAFARAGVALPRWADAQSRLGTPVEPEELETGDAVFFSDPAGRVRHVALYLGAGQVVHAPGPGGRVGLASLYEPALAQAYAGARRY